MSKQREKRVPMGGIKFYLDSRFPSAYFATVRHDKIPPEGIFAGLVDTTKVNTSIAAQVVGDTSPWDSSQVILWSATGRKDDLSNRPSNLFPSEGLLIHRWVDMEGETPRNFDECPGIGSNIDPDQAQRLRYMLGKYPVQDINIKVMEWRIKFPQCIILDETLEVYSGRKRVLWTEPVVVTTGGKWRYHMRYGDGRVELKAKEGYSHAEFEIDSKELDETERRDTDPRIIKVIGGFRYKTLNMGEVVDGIAQLRAQGSSAEESMREYFNPYVKVEYRDNLLGKSY